MARAPNIKGFRPGKVPVDHLTALWQVGHGRSRAEASTTSRDALPSASSSPPIQPEVKLPEEEAEVNGSLMASYDLSFTVSFEVIRRSRFGDFYQARARPPCRAGEDKAHRRTPCRGSPPSQRTFAAKDGAAETGDRVTISFVGRSTASLRRRQRRRRPARIGSGQFIPGFEEQLVGAKAGDDLTVKVTFPDDYGATIAESRQLRFKVEKVEAGSDLPETRSTRRPRAGLRTSTGCAPGMVQDRIGEDSAA